MRVFRGFPDIAQDHVALTIGNFDGVHRGHQAMLTRLTEAAEDLGLPSAVLTFDPHPRECFARDTAPPRLTSKRLGVRWVLVGDDFRFGRGRTGNLAVLRAAARNFSVEAMRTVSIDNERASSTAVRNALAAGELDHAARLLGHPYAISGRVAHGDKLGADLGFPTANIVLRHKPALGGIFAVRVHGLGSSPRSGVASLGVRPTIKVDARPLLEVFIFDFNEPIYGRRVNVEFVHKLRDEERYSDLETLTRQIHADVAQAREYFASHT